MGRSGAPMAFVDRWGNVSFVPSTVSEEMTDRLGRMLSVAAYGRGLGAAGHLMQMREAKPMFIRGTLLTAVDLGRALREGRAAGKDARGGGAPDPWSRALRRGGGRHGMA